MKRTLQNSCNAPIRLHVQGRSKWKWLTTRWQTCERPELQVSLIFVRDMNLQRFSQARLTWICKSIFPYVLKTNQLLSRQATRSSAVSTNLAILMPWRSTSCHALKNWLPNSWKCWRIEAIGEAKHGVWNPRPDPDDPGFGPSSMLKPCPRFTPRHPKSVQCMIHVKPQLNQCNQVTIQVFVETMEKALHLSSCNLLQQDATVNNAEIGLTEVFKAAKCRDEKTRFGFSECDRFCVVDLRETSWFGVLCTQHGHQMYCGHQMASDIKTPL